MVKPKSPAPGTIAAIPLDDGCWGFASWLPEGSTQVFDYVADGDPGGFVEAALNSSVAFTTMVHDAAIAGRKPARKKLGVRQLPAEPITISVAYYKFDIISKKYSLHFTDPRPGCSREVSVTKEQFIGLERLAVWDENHIEDRLRDHFEKRKNKWVESLNEPLNEPCRTNTCRAPSFNFEPPRDGDCSVC